MTIFAGGVKVTGPILVNVTATAAPASGVAADPWGFKHTTQRGGDAGFKSPPSEPRMIEEQKDMSITEISDDEFKESATRGLHTMHEDGRITGEELGSALNWLDSPEGREDTVTWEVDER